MIHTAWIVPAVYIFAGLCILFAIVIAVWEPK